MYDGVLSFLLSLVWGRSLISLPVVNKNHGDDIPAHDERDERENVHDVSHCLLPN